MNSRMDRYHKNKNTNLRSQRNRNLYSDIYSNSRYTNIEGIASIDNANEIDITKIKEMLKNRENYQKERQYRKITGETETPERTVIRRRIAPDTEERNYDIRDVLTKAKENKQPDDKERVLKNTQYDILKNLDLKRQQEQNSKSEEEELKELINTITNTSMLNKLGDADLAADLLRTLTSNSAQVGELNNVRKLMDEDKGKPQPPEMDENFFTSSLKLSQKDFENGDKKSLGIFSKIIIAILILIIIAAIAFLVITHL